MNIPGLGDFTELMKQAQQAKERLEQTQRDLRNRIVSAEAGVGMVTVTMNGVQELQSISIDPSILSPDNAQMVQDLVLAAINKATAEAREQAQSEMQRITGMMPKIPGMPF
jgi:nucleoid-associated protein EbfC